MPPDTPILDYMSLCTKPHYFLTSQVVYLFPIEPEVLPPHPYTILVLTAH
jgi:hypothetical protein